MELNLKDLEKTLGHKFTNIALLETALTHRSYINEHKQAEEHNERLEFLGDAVLELITTEYLYKNYPTQPEGELTTWRSALVKGEQLAEVATTMGLGEYFRMSKGESRSGGRKKNYLLANLFEAVLGAIYLDGGYESARQLVARVILTRLETILKSGAHIDAKSKFQNLAQEKAGVTPEYELVSAVGPDHDKVFEMSALLGKKKVGTGKGKNKQAAQQSAAANALSELGWED